LLSSQWRRTPEGEEREPSRLSEQLFGLLPLPESLTVGGWVRQGYIAVYGNGALLDRRWLQMRADLGAHYKLGRFRVAGTLGYNTAESGPYAQQAWINGANDTGNLVSREHWLGADFLDERVLVRAGRVNLPFGLRNIEHTTWARTITRTDVNQNQQHGISVAYNGDRLRGEAMLVLGNFQISPDEYRDRGIVAFGELGLTPRLAVGVSTLALHAGSDAFTGAATWRQAHGVFARAVPWKPLVLLGELDAVIRSPSGLSTDVGYVALLQADLEVWRGLHANLAFEAMDQGGSDFWHVGGWFGAAWFFLPHCELRFDVVERAQSLGPSITSLLTQVQLYL
jgi:hypothetical protein